MKITYLESVEREAIAKVLRLQVPIRYPEDVPESFFGRHGNEVKLDLDIDAKRVVGFKGAPLDLYLKVVDEGMYFLLGADGKVIAKKLNDYVPHFLPGEHYGDYLILQTDADGNINGWSFTKEELLESFDLDSADEEF